MTPLKAKLIDLLSERDFSIPELARLLHTDENHVIHLVFRLQQDKQPIVIEQGYVYLSKKVDISAFFAGVGALCLLGTLFLLGGAWS